jgi:hypothetical protein
MLPPPTIALVGWTSEQQAAVAITAMSARMMFLPKE